MKRILVMILLFALICVSGCQGAKPAAGNSDGIPLDALDVKPTPDSTASVSSDAVESSDAQPTETPVIGENKTVELITGKEETVNGFSVTLAEQEGETEDSIVAMVGENTYTVAKGYFEKAYLCGRENGTTCLIICSMNEEMSNTLLLKLNSENEKLFVKTDSVTGTLLSLENDIMRISRPVDLLGTWMATREYRITKKFKVKDTDNKLWTVKADSSRNMTALCDIKARIYDTQTTTAILEGSEVIAVYLDADYDYAVLKDVNSGALYKVYVESNGYGGFIVEDTGAEEGCFSNIQYSG